MKKKCSKCGKTKPATAFSKDRIKRDGLRGSCKLCDSVRAKAYYQDHRERLLTLASKYYKLHPSASLEAMAQWRKANMDKCRAYSAKWLKANPDKQRERAARCRKAKPEKYREYGAKWCKENLDKRSNVAAQRRARKCGVNAEKVDRNVVYDRDKGFCHICGVAVFHDNWHLDHIVPLSKGGEHSYKNVAVSHPFCNLSKGAA